jgi:mannan polymerase II complex MNN11 subunit
MNPHTEFFFSLSPYAIIMNDSFSIVDDIMAKDRMEQLMLKDVPVVPPDSVIHTFSHLRGDQIDLAISKDEEGLNSDSFVLRQGEWSKFLLDTWFDPLYRTYNLQKAQAHALVSTKCGSL